MFRLYDVARKLNQNTQIPNLIKVTFLLYLLFMLLFGILVLSCVEIQ